VGVNCCNYSFSFDGNVPIVIKKNLNFMNLGSISENYNFEKRIAVTPEIAKKYISLGFNLTLPNNYGSHLGFIDENYKDLGVNFLDNEQEIIKNSEILIQLGLPDEEKISLLKENQNLVGSLNVFLNREKLEKLKSKNINCFSLEMLPRITRAQSMDILSSQANLAGYKAVVEAFQVYEKAIPMMMTAAGTIPAAKVLVVGAGVAGLQAIATAKRMGAVVFATDVRMASKEQVESLGGKFLTVEGSENLETEGGYAKEASDEFKKKQEELLTETLKKIDIVICTALIPGREAPKIIKEEMFKNLQPGSVIYDLAAVQGGNTVFTKVDEVVEKDGVKILGEANILNKLPVSASNLYAKNVFNFISNLYDKENKKLNVNLEDEIIEKTLIK
jgi:NAD(P) transhydrogenase subunit alpha